MTKEEAIKKIKWEIAGLIIDKDAREALETLIPELRESEDDRIVRCIEVALTDVDEQRFKDFGTTLKDCIAYLEKQKHSLNFDAISSWLRDHVSRYVNSEYNEFHNCTEYDGTINIERLIADLKVAVDSGAFDIHEQKEQKQNPLIKIMEDKKAITEDIRNGIPTKTIEKERNVKFATPVDVSHTEWSEEDKEMKLLVFRIINGFYNWTRYIGDDCEKAKKAVDWVRNLSPCLHTKPELSDEDKKDV